MKLALTSTARTGALADGASLQKALSYITRGPKALGMKALALMLALLMLPASGLVGCAGDTAPGGASIAPESTSVSPPPDTATSASPSSPGDSTPVAEEVFDVEIPEFRVTINGVEISRDSVSGCPVYRVGSYPVNSSGTETEVAYIGYAIKDVLKVAGLDEEYIWLEATADDGNTITLTGSVIGEDTTLLAMTKDGSPFKESPWLAPCSDKISGNYLKGTVSILVNTTEGAPSLGD